jgi:eukaryotic-like serine/threonine-protein kinase
MIGQVVGRYHIVEQLGAGGMGVVYRARDTQLERDVALKFLSSSATTDDMGRQRLLREARSISALNHPHICQVFEIGRADGHDFIAMEWVRGLPLRDHIPAQGLPPGTTIRYGRQIASALAHAHERGVIHRDLKSANVMITPEGEVKVLDFGLARQAYDAAGGPSAELSLTSEGTIVGTPAYFAPEVLRGNKASAASDLWALGVILYEMTSGRLPFRGNTVIETCTSILNDEPPKLPERVPPGLRSIILRCLAKEPAHRYRSAGEVAAALEAVHSDTGDVVVPGAGARRPLRALAWAAGLALLLALCAAAYLARDRLFGGAPSSAPAIRSLAVLPLANLSGDPGQDYFADGMTEELITSLTPLPDLKVISRTSVMHYKGTNKPMPQIARELGVDGIVEGSVTRSGNRVRVTAQLLDAAHDRHLWGHTYERQLEEVLTLQHDIASDIAQEIQIQLTPGMADMRRLNHPLNTQAYELYLKGEYELDKVEPEAVKRAEDYFQQAIVLDPDDARFYSGLADANVVASEVLGILPMQVGMTRAKAAASRALALDPNLGQAHVSYAIALFFGDWNWKGAEEHVKKGIALDPGYSLGHLIYALILGAKGQGEESVRENRRALELDPLSFLNNWNLISVLGQARRYDEAVAQGRRALGMFPGRRLALIDQIAAICERRKDYQGAIDAARGGWPEERGGQKFVEEMTIRYRAGGERGYYEFWLEQLAKAPPSVVSPYRLAEIHARLGNRDQAFAQLQRAFADHTSDLLWLGVDPSFESVHDDPRYAAMLRTIGLAAGGGA